jgi:hypothetical protein
MDVTKVTTMNQPVTLAIFLVSIGPHPSPSKPATQRGAPKGQSCGHPDPPAQRRSVAD